MAFFATSPAARTSLIYITVGALLLIWTSVWAVFLHNNPPATNNPYYWVAGFMATGLICLLIGFGLGRIGRAAHKAELAIKTPPVIVPGGGPTVVNPNEPPKVVETKIPVTAAGATTLPGGTATAPAKPDVN